MYTAGDAMRSGPPITHIREQQLSETVIRLQRGLLRLLFAFHGYSPEIDNRLKKLGNMVRSGQRTNEFNQLVDDTINSVVPLAGARQSNRIGDILFRLLGRLEPTLVPADDLRDLRTRASALDDSGVDDFVRDCAACLNRIGERHDLTSQSGDAREAFRHLFDVLAVPEPIASQYKAIQQRFTQVANRGEVLALVDQLAKVLQGAVEQQGCDISDGSTLMAFRDLIVEMLDRISVPNAAKSRADSIRRALTAAYSAADLRAALVAFANLVELMKGLLQAEIRQLTGFLEQIHRRLHDIDVHVEIAQALHAGSQTDCQAMNFKVGQHLNDIRHGCSEAADMESLKSRIENRLDQINQNLATYMAQEDKRFIEARGTLDALTSEIRDLEGTTQRLRTDLEIQHERALSDALTGIPNRLAYETRIESDYARWQRHGGSLSLAVIDVDNFKQINDSYGHGAGDKVLATIAARLQEHLRASDHLSRFGGEEFVLILPETELREAEIVVDKLRTMIAKCRFHYKTTPVSVSVSCGVAEFHAGDAIEQVFDRADEAMFLAKRRGRNCCVGECELAKAAVNG